MPPKRHLEEDQQQQQNPPIPLLVVGCGQRGSVYSSFATSYPDLCKIVAIAEPNEHRRNKLVSLHPTIKHVFTDWKDALKAGPEGTEALAVLICLQDTLHEEATIAFAAQSKYVGILVEKPLATTPEGCGKIIQAITTNRPDSNPLFFAIGHVLRYAPQFKLLDALLSQKIIGDVVSIAHTEPVGAKHFAHSYVRNPAWRNSETSCFSLMTKSCHDLDLIQWIIKTISSTSTPPSSKRTWHAQKVSSFGNLTHFRQDRKPLAAGSATRCLECPLEPSCPYSAKKIYLDAYTDRRVTGWPVSVITDIIDIEHITTALQTTDYGKCVYESSNNVVDNQIVNIEYKTPLGPVTVNFSMIAFTEDVCQRRTVIYGSRGELTSWQRLGKIDVYDFNTGVKETFTPELSYKRKSGNKLLRGHGGGDGSIMLAFVSAMRAYLYGEKDAVVGNETPKERVARLQEKFLGTTPEEVLESHLLVFAAEKARLESSVVEFENGVKKEWMEKFGIRH